MTEHVNFESFDTWASKIKTDNDMLKAELDKMCTEIKKMGSVSYEGMTSDKIVESIEALKPKIENYYRVVETYEKFITSVGQTYKNIELVNMGIVPEH